MKHDDNLKGQSELELEAGEVQLSKEGSRSPQSCKLCSASFTSELGLLLHFREKHLEFFSDSDDDESESESDIESEEPETTTLGFLTDYERALLQVPAFNPFSESEDELDTESASEDDDDNFCKLFDFEAEDFSRNARNGDDGKGAKDHRPPVEPGEPLPSSHDGPSSTSTEPTPSKRISPIRNCNQRTLLSTARDKRQLTLALLPLLQSPQKIGHNSMRRGVNVNPLTTSKMSTLGVDNRNDDDDKSEAEQSRTESIQSTSLKLKPNPRVPMSNKSNNAKTKTSKLQAEDAPQVKLKKRHSAPQFKCVFCGKTFFQFYLFCNHIRNYTLEQPFFCKFCEASFQRKEYLRKHMWRRHPEAAFKCKLCPSSFSSKKELTTHSAIHRKTRIFTCSICSRGFDQKHLLKEHKRIHAKERRFECEYCKKRFYLKQTMTRHLTQHTDEAVYECVHCKRRFNRKFSLQIHMATHTTRGNRFECAQCNIRFSCKSNLSRHMKLHTLKMPYKCAHCNKGYTRLGHLKKHMEKIHNQDNSSGFPLFDEHFVPRKV